MADYDDDGFEYSASEDGDSEMPSEEDEEVQEPSTKVMTTDSLLREMNDLIQSVAQIVQIHTGSCRILLHEFHWNKESLLEKFYESGDMDSFLQQCRILPDPAKMGAGVEGAKDDCDICCCLDTLVGLKCRHVACRTCWEQYISTKVLKDHTSVIECMFPGCKLLIDDEKVLALMGPNDMVHNAFSRICISNFVERNRLTRWCPGVDCGKALKVSQSDSRTVKCDCGCRFCFECGQEQHEPVNCKILKLWQKKCNDDSETSNWICANTKECPKCHVSVEKNGGCNIMTCNNKSCKFEWCWMCMGAAPNHGANHACNTFDESNTATSQASSRAALERYLHYYNRYANHQKSLELEQKLYSGVQVSKQEIWKHSQMWDKEGNSRLRRPTLLTQMQKMQESGMSWVEVQFLKKAVDVLAECRRTLMYTYAFAYYLIGCNEKQIFEDNQKDLEMATEQLSGLLERDLTTEDLVALKQNVQDKYRYVEHRRNVLLDHCAEGMEKDTWQFNV